MLTQKELLDAVDTELTRLFGSGFPLYRNLVPVDFVRPSAMTRISRQEMSCLNRFFVQRTAIVMITLFAETDAYHNTDMDALFAISDKVMEHFSSPCLPVESRFLDLGTVTCTQYADYVELSVPVSWEDDRVQSKTAHEFMGDVNLRLE